MEAGEFITLIGQARRMTTGADWVLVRMTFQGLPGPNARLTELDAGSYTLVDTIGLHFLKLR